MRILGVDYGTKKIGLALSDAEAKFAFPLKVLKPTSSQDVALEIKKICGEKAIGKIVLGQPAGYKGDSGAILKKIEGFKKEMERTLGLPVVYENEVLTTRQTRRPLELGRPRGRISNYRNSIPIVKDVDAAAAALILQSYLDKISEKNERGSGDGK